MLGMYHLHKVSLDFFWKILEFGFIFYDLENLSGLRIFLAHLTLCELLHHLLVYFSCGINHLIEKGSRSSQKNLRLKKKLAPNGTKS